MVDCFQLVLLCTVILNCCVLPSWCFWAEVCCLVFCCDTSIEADANADEGITCVLYLWCYVCWMDEETGGGGPCLDISWSCFW